MSRRLPNYIRTYRRRAGLSQDEMAFLLGCRDGSKVSRYERFFRQPSFETALALEAIFGTSAPELFAGLYEKTLLIIQERAQTMAERLAQSDANRKNKRKLELLNAISIRN
jgi:transcriptional regulator with XRE-family HTH domain